MSIVNGTTYKKGTPMDCRVALETARKNNYRITVDYGDVNTGKSWGETYDISGYVGRSTGEVQVPLLINNKRSMGGGAILDDCILSIRFSNKKEGGYLYKSVAVKA